MKTNGTRNLLAIMLTLALALTMLLPGGAFAAGDKAAGEGSGLWIASSPEEPDGGAARNDGGSEPPGGDEGGGLPGGGEDGGALPPEGGDEDGALPPEGGDETPIEGEDELPLAALVDETDEIVAFATASQLAATINGFVHGGTGTLNAISSESKVLVWGTVTGVTNKLTLNIDSGIEVLWQASYSGSGGLICLQGTGAFDVGGVIASTGALVVYNDSDNNGRVTISVSSGSVAGTSLVVYGVDSDVKVSGGTVKSTSNYGATIGTNGGVTVSGGTVSAAGQGSAAIVSTTGNVSISGGRVEATGAEGNAVRTTAGKVTVPGGTVETTGAGGTAVSTTSGNVAVMGGTVKATGAGGKGIYTTLGGIAISGASTVEADGNAAECEKGMIRVSGGSVKSTGSSSSSTSPRIALYSATNVAEGIEISGGSVSATGSYGIAAKSEMKPISISGGSVTATGKYGKAAEGYSLINITGGTVETSGSNGKATSTTDGTILISGGTVRAAGSGSHAIYISLSAGKAAYYKGTVTGAYYCPATGVIAEVDRLKVSASLNGSSTGIAKKMGSGNITWYCTDSVTPKLQVGLSLYYPWGYYDEINITSSSTVAQIRAAVQNAVNMAANKDPVIVKGSKPNVSEETLHINIPLNKVIYWQAGYAGSADTLIRLTGDGEFVVCGGLANQIVNSKARATALYFEGAKATPALGVFSLNASDGDSKVRATGEDSKAIRTDNRRVNVFGYGQVETTGNYSTAVNTYGGDVYVNGGTVSSSGAYAVFTNNGKVDVLGGGIVKATGAGGMGVFNDSGKTTVNRGSVEGIGVGIRTVSGNVEVIKKPSTGESEVKSAKYAIYTTSGNVDIQMGKVKSTWDEGAAIITQSGNVSVSPDGTGSLEVSATGYGSVGIKTDYGRITVGGGEVSVTNANTGAAISTGMGSITVTDGNVKAAGTSCSAIKTVSGDINIAGGTVESPSAGSSVLRTDIGCVAVTGGKVDGFATAIRVVGEGVAAYRAGTIAKGATDTAKGLIVEAASTKVPPERNGMSKGLVVKSGDGEALWNCNSASPAIEFIFGSARRHLAWGSYGPASSPNISITPSLAMITSASGTAGFTALLHDPNTDATLIQWSISDDVNYEITPSDDKATATVKLRTGKTLNAKTLVVTAVYDSIFTAIATVEIVPGAGSMTKGNVRLLETSVTVNRVKDVGALLPVLLTKQDLAAIGTMSADGWADSPNPDTGNIVVNKVGLFTKANNGGYTVPVTKYEARMHKADNRYLEINALASNAPDINGVMVKFQFEGAGGAEFVEAGVINIKAATKYPAINLKAGELNLVYPERTASLTATSPSGACTIKGIGAPKSTVKLDGGKLALDGMKKADKVSVSVEVEVAGYKSSYKTAPKVTVKVVNSLPKLKLSKTSITLVPRNVGNTAVQIKLLPGDKNPFESGYKISGVIQSATDASGKKITKGKSELDVAYKDGVITVEPKKGCKTGTALLKVSFDGLAKTAYLPLKVTMLSGASQVSLSTKVKSATIGVYYSPGSGYPIAVIPIALNAANLVIDDWEVVGVDDKKGFTGKIAEALTFSRTPDGAMLNITGHDELEKLLGAKKANKSYNIKIGSKRVKDAKGAVKTVTFKLTVTATAVNITLTPKGKIDIANPKSSIAFAVKWNHTDALDDVILETAREDSAASADFKVINLTANSFKIAAAHDKLIPGVKYTVYAKIFCGSAFYATKAISITPSQTASKAKQDKKAVKLSTAMPHSGEAVKLKLTTPANVGLGHVRVAAASNTPFVAGDGFSVRQTSSDTWVLCFKDGRVPTPKTGKLKGSYGVKLELWAARTYTTEGGALSALSIPDPKNPGKQIAKTKPTIVTVTANIKQPASAPPPAGPSTAVSFTAEQIGGVSGTTDSTGIKLIFSQPVTGLAASGVTLENGTGQAAKGTLSGFGTDYTLNLSSVAKEGLVKVTVTDFPGFKVTPASQSVMVYKKAAVALTDVTYTAVQVGGASGTADSTGIKLTFNKSVTGLAAGNIIITNGTGQTTKGTLSGSGAVYTIELTNVAVQGNVTVGVSNFGDFKVTTAPLSVAVYKDAGSTGTNVTFTAVQVGGTSGTKDSTGIAITFSQSVTGLASSGISITNGTGAATKGALSGSGKSYTIALTSVAAQGTVNVAVSGFGGYNVTTGPQTVTVYKNTSGGTQLPAPGNLRVLDKDSQGVQFGWNAVTGPGMTGYKVYWSDQQTGPWNSDPWADTSVWINGLGPSEDVWFKVAAVSSTSGEGVQTAPVKGATNAVSALAAPERFCLGGSWIVSANNMTIYITRWAGTITYPADATHYRVEKRALGSNGVWGDWQRVSETPVTAIPSIPVTATYGSVAEIRVRCVNGALESDPVSLGPFAMLPWTPDFTSAEMNAFPKPIYGAGNLALKYYWNQQLLQPLDFELRWKPLTGASGYELWMTNYNLDTNPANAKFIRDMPGVNACTYRTVNCQLGMPPETTGISEPKQGITSYYMFIFPYVKVNGVNYKSCFATCAGWVMTGADGWWFK